ncbi:uncharacterized protein [Fopius arisanus]|uniref:Uncharacterized protein n=1 Tax=Fopius arisanus TaxID=64838 RepID=A0A9R1TMK5_9HYME|nr:PREDICTED: uncharacterized protein LOC105271654 [Fopius arisanus]
MKTIIILWTICIVAVFGITLDKELKNACMKEEDANLDAIEKAYHQNEWDDDSKLRCFSVCMMRKWKLIDERDGSWIPNAIREYITKTYPSANVDQVMTKCPLRFDATCTTSYLLQKCWGDLKLSDAAVVA